MILEVTIIGDENDGDVLTNIFDIKHDQIQYIPEVNVIKPEITILEFLNILSTALNEKRDHTYHWSEECATKETILKVIRLVYNKPELNDVYEDLYEEFEEIISEYMPYDDGGHTIHTVESISYIPKSEKIIIFKS